LKQIKLNVNEEIYEVRVEPDWSLLYVLREELGLTGTKKGCGDGACGMCMVIMDGKLVHSCQILAVKAAGRRVLTVEGLARDGKLHPLQEMFIEYGAIQCGFCTPGMLMAGKVLLDRNPNPTEEEVKETLSRVLCRCTGYVKPIQAILAGAKKLRSEKA